MHPLRALLPALVLLAACTTTVRPEPAPLPIVASDQEPLDLGPRDVVVTEMDADATIEVPEGRLVYIELTNDEGPAYEWELWVSTISFGEPQLEEANEHKSVYVFDTTGIPVGREHLHVFGYGDPSCAHFQCTARTFSIRTKVRERVDPIEG